jgi:hypothetical protein
MSCIISRRFATPERHQYIMLSCNVLYIYVFIWVSTDALNRQPFLTYRASAFDLRPCKLICSSTQCRCYATWRLTCIGDIGPMMSYATCNLTCTCTAQSWDKLASGAGKWRFCLPSIVPRSRRNLVRVLCCWSMFHWHVTLGEFRWTFVLLRLPLWSSKCIPTSFTKCTCCIMLRAKSNIPEHIIVWHVRGTYPCITPQLC